MKRRITVLILILSVIVAVCCSCDKVQAASKNIHSKDESAFNTSNPFYDNSEVPAIPSKGQYDSLVDSALETYKESKLSYLRGMQEQYTAFGNYLKFSSNRDYTTKQFKPDEKGIPMALYQGTFYYNPVTVSQYTLYIHGKYLEDSSYLDAFIYAADKLISMQDSDGAFRYAFDFDYYLTGEKMKSGWVSGMAQGQAISALVRAYHVTKDKKYLTAAENAYQFLNVPVEKGGTKATLGDLYSGWNKYIIYEEYISTPHSYTLNGFMYAMLGVYDLSQTDSTSASDAGQKFNQCIQTLKLILPYFDIGGFTCYDLGYITFNRAPHISVRYHTDHIFLLQSLINITHDKELTEKRNVYIGYVGVEEPIDKN